MKRTPDNLESALFILLAPLPIGYPLAVATGMLWATHGPLTLPNVVAVGAFVYLARLGVKGLGDPEKPYDLLVIVVIRYAILAAVVLAVRALVGDGVSL